MDVGDPQAQPCKKHVESYGSGAYGVGPNPVLNSSSSTSRANGPSKNFSHNLHLCMVFPTCKNHDVKLMAPLVQKGERFALGSGRPGAKLWRVF